MLAHRAKATAQAWPEGPCHGPHRRAVGHMDIYTSDHPMTELANTVHVQFHSTPFQTRTWERTSGLWVGSVHSSMYALLRELLLSRTMCLLVLPRRRISGGAAVLSSGSDDPDGIRSIKWIIQYFIANDPSSKRLMTPTSRLNCWSSWKLKEYSFFLWKHNLLAVLCYFQSTINAAIKRIWYIN